MAENKVYTAIGLMSGTSLDAVDAALIETDGYSYIKPLSFISLPYEESIRAEIRACYGQKDRSAPVVQAAEKIVATEHVKAVKALLDHAKITASDVDLIGFHGQTIYHAPKDGVTHQIGDASLLAQEAGIDVVADFRSNDVKLGGEGAPLAPLYHWARIHSAKQEFPVVVLNIGGVSNSTWLGANDDEIMAFDCGPGNALMDDWVQRHTGKRYDEDGRLAESGATKTELVEEWLQHDYFARPAPKSMDRDQWDIAGLGKLTHELNELSIEDGAATFLKFTVEAIVKGVEQMPSPPKHWYACGGGRHNKALMKHLAQRLSELGYGALHSVDDLGWDGDATEAECFGYLAVRSKLGLFLSLPTTTNTPAPCTGGVYYKRS
jgi:anhydro-N-acetylmuramic acid kinase